MSRKTQNSQLDLTALKPLDADQTEFENPFEDATLARYLETVTSWHGYVRFLGLPHLQDNPDLPIDRLFVEPELTIGLVGPEGFTESTRREELRIVLENNQWLVVLGDPGSGKSTMVNYLTWELSRKFASSWLPWLFFGDGNQPRPIPIPIVLREVLREFPVDEPLNWKDLLERFFSHAMFESDKGFVADLRIKFEKYFERGQAFFLVDGIDEIGSVQVRKKLRDAIWEGMIRYPKCRWIMTSRVLGYDEVRFNHAVRDETLEEREHRIQAEEELEQIADPTFRKMRSAEKRGGRMFDGGPGFHFHTDKLEKIGHRVCQIRYVAPFSDEKVSHFVTNWFSHRDAVAKRSDATAEKLLEAIRQSEDTVDLARVPNFLTLISLIYRVEAELPNGRTRLYEKIVQAYLQSIDRVREIRTVNYDWMEIKRWLAHVGFQMQMTRTGVKAKDNESLLVERSAVEKWLRKGMKQTGKEVTDEQLDELIQFLGRRSGLLIPRGVDKKGNNLYAFLHLSFQEYLAAVYIYQEIDDEPDFFWPDYQSEFKTLLKTLPNKVYWHETIVFLFELFDVEGKRKTSERFFTQIFPKIDDLKYDDSLRLVGRLAVDSHVNFESLDLKGNLITRIAELEVPSTSIFNDRESILGDLIGFCDSSALSFVANSIVKFVDRSENNAVSFARSKLSQLPPELLTIEFRKKTKQLYLDQTQVSDLKPLAGLTGLQWLYLQQTQVSDLKPLAGLTGLQQLYLNQTQVSDLKPLAGLTGLRELSLNQTQVSDLKPLAGLTGLQWLSLDQTQVSDLKPLAGLTGLQWLYLQQTQVSDLKPLAGLTGLQQLSLNQTQVSDLKPLAGLTGLRELSLNQTQVSDLKPLAGLTGLQWLSLDQTQVSDLKPLAGLTGLQWLYLQQTQVSDLKPLAGLTGLQQLYLNQTQVSDLKPLAGLTGLQRLYLDQTQVSDLKPLAGLTGLQQLYLNQTQVSDLKPLAGLTGLQRLYLDQTQVSDLKPLAGLTGLQRLYLQQTQVSDSETINELEKRGVTVYR